jgi:hypothetical protein
MIRMTNEPPLFDQCSIIMPFAHYDSATAWQRRMMKLRLLVDFETQLDSDSAA